MKANGDTADPALSGAISPRVPCSLRTPGHSASIKKEDPTAIILKNNDIKFLRYLFLAVERST
jgi:hypothetical protein